MFVIRLIWVLALTIISFVGNAISIDSLKKAIHITDVPKEKITIYNQIANYFYQINSDSAVYFANKGIQLAQDISDKPSLAAFLNLKGNSYLRFSYYNLALKCFEEAMELNLKENNLVFLSGNYNNMGMVFEELKDYQTAINYYKRSLQIDRQNKDTFGIMIGNLNLGSAYIGLENFENAQLFIDSSIFLAEKLSFEDAKVYNYFNLGEVHLKKSENKKALMYFKLALDVSKRIEPRNKSIEILANIKMAETLFLLGQKENTSQILAELKEKFNSDFKLKESLEMLSLEYFIASSEQQFELALDLLKQKNFLEDSIKQKLENNKIDELRLQYEMKELELTNEILELDKQRNERIIEQQKFGIFLSIFVLLILSFLIYLLAITNKKNQKTTELLKLKTNEAEEQKRIIEEKLAEQEELTRIKDRLYAVITHDIKTPLNNLQGILELASMQTKEAIDFEEYLKITSEQIYSSINHIDNVLTWTKAQMSSFDLNNATKSVKVFIEENVHLLENLAKLNNITINISMKMDVDVTTDFNILGIVLRNLLTNAIKYSPKNSEISVSGSYKYEILMIEVVDNGPGVGEDIAERLFSDAVRGSSTRDKISGSGMGLMLSKIILEKINGRLDYKPNPFGGSIFKIILNT